MQNPLLYYKKPRKPLLQNHNIHNRNEDFFPYNTTSKSYSDVPKEHNPKTETR